MLPDDGITDIIGPPALTGPKPRLHISDEPSGGPIMQGIILRPNIYQGALCASYNYKARRVTYSLLTTRIIGPNQRTFFGRDQRYSIVRESFQR